MMLATKLQEAAANSTLPTYIEDVFSTYLYTGTGAAQTITNNIDLSTKGGLVWMKDRGSNPSYQFNVLVDTARSGLLISNSTDAESGSGLTTYNTNGFRINAGYTAWNSSGQNYASWTFRKQPKFFDVVTYTGTGTASQTISHNLGSAPGCIIIKRTDSTSNWFVGHNYDANKVLYLNSDAGATNISWNGWIFDPTTFRTPSISGSPDVNVSGATYVAYLFASNAGGFGLTGTDSVIRCGSFNPDSYNYLVTNIGWEPQWLLIKKANAGSDWFLMDTMRGFTVNSRNDSILKPNTSLAEESFNLGSPESTGFGFEGGDTGTYIYIAIRRGPMKVPTSGTSVFSPTANAGTGSQKTVTTNFPVDLTINSALSAATHVFTDRLRGGGINVSPRLYSQFADAETNTSSGRGILFDSNTGFTLTSNYINGSGDNYIYYAIGRAPSFFDEVCYSGNDTAGTTQAHNLGVAPEFMIVKRRNQADGWFCYHSALGATKYIPLNDYQPATTTSSIWDNTAPTASVFTLGWNSAVNGSGSTYVAYLFSTLAGVSKVGSYTGTGTTLQVNCGFTSGARFVLIKRTNGSGDSADGWYVWDSARGIVSGNDPYLLLNSTAAEVTSTDYIDTYSAGFEISSTAPAAINASGGTYIFLAIA